MDEDEVKLWQDMADMTLERCRKKCHSLGSCCEDFYCEMAAGIMQKSGVSVPPRPFRDKDGRCIIPPHYRPLCSLHQCDINGLGFAKDDPEWTKRYFELREKIEAIGYDEATGL
jgi:hypothetical protein